jgi:hypothetical protein
VSIRREWATFQTADGTVVQIYWWQRDGCTRCCAMSNRAAGSTRAAASTIWTWRSPLG